jgi:hypothetical protein
MGVPSYNTEQELVQLESLGLRLEPDAVALYFATNDIEPRMWVYERRRSWFADFAQRSYAASIAAVLCQRIRSRMGSPLEPIHYSDYAPGNPRWEAIATALRRIAQRLRERHLPFLVVSAGPPDAPHLRLLREIGSEEGFPVEQLDGAIDARWAAEPARYVNSASDPHCNAAGCAILAEHLAELLARSGAL